MAKAIAKFWRVQGYDSQTLIFERLLPYGALSENQVINLMQRLLSKHLDDDDLVAASMRRNSNQYMPTLEPHRDYGPGRRSTIMIGQNPHFVAAVFQEDEIN